MQMHTRFPTAFHTKQQYQKLNAVTCSLQVGTVCEPKTQSTNEPQHYCDMCLRVDVRLQVTNRGTETLPPVHHYACVFSVSACSGYAKK